MVVAEEEEEVKVEKEGEVEVEETPHSVCIGPLMAEM